MSRESSKQNLSPRLLIVDDKEQMRDVLQKFLAAEGYRIETAASGKEALEKISGENYNLILTDIKMPGMDGNELLAEILKRDSDAVVILMTAFGSIEAAVSAIKRGAADYISKPFQMDEVLLRISRALKERNLQKRVADLEEKIALHDATRKIIGNSAAIKRLRQIIERFAPLEDTVLITGETGTGKELVARALHEAGARKNKPFVALDCSSIPETLIESEFFGHEKGAFTGADRLRQGLFEIAADGTLFLDEVESLSPAVQSKLLRVLQEKTFRRVGGRHDLSFKARIISASNQNLLQLIEENHFRRDLYYRFAVLPIEIPPLRERREDVSDLINYFLRQRGANLKFSPEAMRILINHEWRGNVRELENVISYLTALGGETVKESDLPMQTANVKSQKTGEPLLPLAELEKHHICRVFESTNRNRLQTAKLLGIDRRTLFNKLRQYGFGDK
ncbi:MAG TPA: sigma-54 dependent transcriptional regulator [Pyrinomonadaceae bacterium]